MKPVEVVEIKNIAEYELERKTLRPAMIALKDRRRVRVGDHLTFLFENRETVRYQIQEMMRIERMVEPDAIRHEVDTYNELIPFSGELSASLLIEYDSPEVRAVVLRDLLGLEEHISIAVGDLPPARARFDTRQISDDRISAVQYVKFPLTPEQRARWKQGARIVVDHPKYMAEAVLTPAQLEELAKDFE
ncbi:MAG: DUF3501 family protein [Acidobacteriota bacterium]